MASLPPSQRRPSQRTSSPEASSSLTRASSSAHSAVSEDSQTILLNPSSSSSPSTGNKKEEHADTSPSSAVSSSRQDASPATAAATAATTATTAASSSQSHSNYRDDDDNLKKCWICFSDESEDTPTTSEWRSPCPCALEAHEQCLLDWIADMESPTSRRQRAPSDKILCPQCKEEIHLARPKSVVVDTVKTLELMGHKLVLPGVLAVGGWSIWQLCWAHGAFSLMVVFGQRDGERILEPLLRPPPNPDASLQSLLDYWRERIRLDVGLFCVPSMLVFSRTRLADGILPILPILFFVTKPDADPFADVGKWPPSAGLSFALLPYIRSLYNAYYERVWGEHEQRWLKEIQPRAVLEAAEQNAAAAARANNFEVDNEDDNVLELNIDLGLIDEWEEEEAAQADPEVAAPQEQQAHPLHEPPLDVPIAHAEDQAGVPAVAPAPNVPRQRRQRADAQPAAANNAPGPAPEPRNANLNVAISTNKLFESILGALAFPVISAAMGETLRLLLPRSWTTSNALLRPSWWGGGKPTGLLQQKWGRSIVGGCLFVVVKDAVMLYVRWRMARDHRMRRVLDYKGKRRGGGSAAAA